MAATPQSPDAIGNMRYLTATNSETGITALAGGGQTGATAITAQVSRIDTVATAGDSVALPKISNFQAGDSRPGAIGQLAFIWNNGANSCQVFGATPDTINGIATGTGIALPAGAFLIGWPITYTQSTNVGAWNCAIVGSTTGTMTLAGALTIAGLLTASGGLLGTATNDNAAAGNVGQMITSTVASGSAVSLTTATAADVTTISLTAGDWDVSGSIDYTFGATTSMSQLNASVSLTLNTLSGQAGGSGLGTDATTTWSQAAAVPVNNIVVPIPPVRLSISSTTTVHLVAQATFTVSTCSAFGTIRARRVR